MLGWFFLLVTTLSTYSCDEIDNKGITTQLTVLVIELCLPSFTGILVFQALGQIETFEQLHIPLIS